MRIDDHINNSIAYERYAGFIRDDDPYEVEVLYRGQPDYEPYEFFPKLEDAINKADQLMDDGLEVRVINRDNVAVYPARGGEL